MRLLILVYLVSVDQEPAYLSKLGLSSVLCIMKASQGRNEREKDKERGGGG